MLRAMRLVCRARLECDRGQYGQLQRLVCPFSSVSHPHSLRRPRHVALHLAGPAAVLRFSPARAAVRGCSSGGGGTKPASANRPSLGRPSSGKVREPITRTTVAGFVVVTGGVLLFLYYLKYRKEAMIDHERRRSLGKASLGGPFELVDHNGRPCSSDDLLGQWILLYFGFTHCPDICPDELEKMAKAVDLVAEADKSFRVQPVFISVDPQRDDVTAVGKYVKEFHSQLLGLTGTVEQVRKVCKAYRVYFSEGPKDDDNDYIVDHTIIMYLVDPEGQFVDYYGQNKSAEEISASISFNMIKFNRLMKGTFW